MVTSQASAIIKAVSGTLKEALSLWKVFINTREAAYRRAMDKKKAKAIDAAEKFILTYKDSTIDDEKKLKLLNKYMDEFFKYNN